MSDNDSSHEDYKVDERPADAGSDTPDATDPDVQAESRNTESEAESKAKLPDEPLEGQR